MNRTRLPAAMVLAVASFVAMAQQTKTPSSMPDWNISDAQSTQTASVIEFSLKTGKLQWREATKDESIVQVRVLAESTSRNIGPISFSDIGLKSRPDNTTSAPREFALLTVGTWNQRCTYLDWREIPNKQQANIGLGSGDQFRVFKAGEKNPQLTVNARRMPICLAFAVPKSMPGDWTVRIGPFELPVAQGMTAFAVTSAQAQGQSTKTVDPEPVSKSTDVAAARSPHGRFVPGAIAAILAIALVLYYRRRNLSQQGSGAPVLVSPDAASNPPIPVLTKADIPTAFIAQEDQPGPGGAMLAAASRAMQAEDLATAGVCARQSIDLGLSPAHIGKAQLFLAEAAIARGDLLEAIHSYRQCLRKDQAVLRSALPAAANLALIYNKLGMRESARLAEQIVASGPKTDDVLHPIRIQRINQLAVALKRSMRADRVRSLLQSARHIFQPAKQGSAKAK